MIFSDLLNFNLYNASSGNVPNACESSGLDLSTQDMDKMSFDHLKKGEGQHL